MMNMTRIGQMLHEEHQRTLTMLNDLEGRIYGAAAKKPLDAADAGDRRRLEAVLSVVDEDVERHFAFEEEVLFPILDDAGAADMVQMLTYEHKAIRPIAQRLRELAAGALEPGFGAGEWDEFRTLARELIEREMFHIQKEEIGLVQGLSHVLDPEADGELSLRYAEYRS